MFYLLFFFIYLLLAEAAAIYCIDEIPETEINNYVGSK